VKFWCSASFLPPNALLEVARAAEDAGFDGVMVADHLVFPRRLTSEYPYSKGGVPPWEVENPWPDPWIVIGAMAAVTTRVRLSTNIYIAPARHPILVAKADATAASFADGRVAFGAGVGWMREEFMAVEQDFHTRGRRLDEMLEILPALWRGDVVEHRGSHYAFDALSISPVPSAPIPIYTGGDSDAALRRAARTDGWIGSLYDPAHAAGRIRDLRAVQTELGIEPRDDFEIFVALRGRPRDIDAYRRVFDVGATSVMCAPCHSVPVAERTPQRLRSEIESFAEHVIEPMRRDAAA